MLNTFAEMWESWLGEEGMNQFRLNGFYTIFNKDYNFRIIALNT